MQLTCEQILEAVEIHVKGKDTDGVNHYVFFDTAKGEFVERIGDTKEGVETHTNLIEVYNNKEFHGRYNRYGIIHKELEEKAHSILDKLYEDENINSSTYHRVRKYRNEDLTTWLLQHKLGACSSYINPQRRLEHDIHDVAQIISWRLDEQGYLV